MRIDIPYELHVSFELSPTVPPSKQMNIIKREFDDLYESIQIHFTDSIYRKINISNISFIDPTPFKLRIYRPSNSPTIIAYSYLTIRYEDDEPYTRERYEEIRNEIIETTEYVRERLIPDYDRHFHEYDRDDHYAIERSTRYFVGIPTVIFVPAQEALVNIPRRERLRVLQGIPELPQNVAWKISEYNSGPLMPMNAPERRGVGVPNYLSDETLGTPFETRLARAEQARMPPTPAPVAPTVAPVEIKKKPWWKFWGGKRTRRVKRTKRSKRTQKN